MERHTISHYLPQFARFTVPLGILLGILWYIQTSLVSGTIMAFIFGAGLAWWLAWMASRRKPLTSFQTARGRRTRRYMDLSGSHVDVHRAAEDVLRSICIQGTVGEYGIPNTLAGETQTTMSSWGSEILIQVELLDATVTRVQVLSRPLVSMNIIDFGSNKRLVSGALERLRLRHPVLAEG